MLRLDLSLDNPADNLAVDEALLVSAEQQGGEFIRFWRFAVPVVVLGRGSKIREEVDVAYCEHHSIPILRRCSGGAAIVAGPDCLLYSVVLDLVSRPRLRHIDQAHAFVVGHLAAAIEMQQPEIEFQGTCDLTLRAKKFSGNSLRIARDHLLYHGTILERVDAAIVGRCLQTAPRQPEYRSGRSHEDFMTSIAIDSSKFCDDLALLYDASAKMSDWPNAEMRLLSETKYRQPEWTWRH
jgi:lipoate---protein ligase